VRVKGEASPCRDLAGVIKLIIPLEQSFAYGVEIDSKYAVFAEEDLEAMRECVFCKIIRKEMPADIVLEEGDLIAFRDIRPQAPVHILVVPKEHISSLLDLGEELAGKLLRAAVEIARKEGIAERGFRVVVNCGPEGGQVIPHLHFHVLGGRKLSDALG